MDLLRALETFVRVVETGSFSAVARETGTSHSAATRLIGQLEDHFGVRLFHRTTRRLSLTEDGQDLLNHARHLIETTQEMEATLGRQRTSPTGLVRIGMAPAVATLLVPQLPKLFQRYPGPVGRAGRRRPVRRPDRGAARPGTATRAAGRHLAGRARHRHVRPGAGGRPRPISNSAAPRHTQPTSPGTIA